MKHQLTVKKTITLKGKGIHTGADIKLKIKEAPANTGIVFIRTDLEKKPAIEACVSNLSPDSGSLRCTLIEKNGASVYTTEHLMAALTLFGINNAIIEIDNKELPALDGSALDYVKELQKAGTLEQEGEKKELILKNTVSCEGEGALLTAIPSENLSISYVLRYDTEEHMTQCANFSFEDSAKKKDIFVKEIAPARTGCFENEVEDIIKRGLGKGGNYKNALIIKEGRPIQNEFRFPNELARHKILDLLGDLALLGREVKAHIIGVKSGHSLNARLLRELARL